MFLLTSFQRLFMEPSNSHKTSIKFTSPSGSAVSKGVPVALQNSLFDNMNYSCEILCPVLVAALRTIKWTLMLL